MSAIIYLMSLINQGTPLDSAIRLTGFKYKLNSDQRTALLTAYDNQDYDSADL